MIKVLKPRVDKLAARFNAFSLRERALLAVCTIGGVFLLGNTLLIEPDLVSARSAKRLMVQQETELILAETQLQALKRQLELDPDAAGKVKLAGLKKQLASVESSLKEIESGLVAPEQMNALLERLLARHVNLRLLSFKSLPPQNLAAQPAAASNAQKSSLAGGQNDTPGLYRHGVELKLEGSYSDLHAWLSQLENSPQKLLWGEARFTVVEHPKSVLSVTVFTLSSDKAWLAI